MLVLHFLVSSLPPIFLDTLLDSFFKWLVNFRCSSKVTLNSFLLHICQGLWFSFLRLCTSFVRITNLPRVFVRSYRELEITKVTPTPKSRNFFRVELLTGNSTTSVLDTPQKTESKTKSIQCTIWGQLIKDTKFVIASHAHTITIPFHLRF